jgi:hypothetical protein
MKIGDNVHYIPFDGCDENLIDNGKIKSFSDSGNPFVVYHCNNEWDKWMDYTGQNTPLDRINEGWYQK